MLSRPPLYVHTYGLLIFLYHVESTNYYLSTMYVCTCTSGLLTMYVRVCVCILYIMSLPCTYIIDCISLPYMVEKY